MKYRLFNAVKIGFLTIILLLPVYHGFAQTENSKSAGQLANDCRLKGIGLLKKQQYDQAINYFHAGLKIAQQASLDSFAAVHLILLGNAYRYKTDFDSALYFLRKAEMIANENKYIAIQASILIESYAVFSRADKPDSVAITVFRMTEMLPKLDSNSSECQKIEMYLGHDNKHKAKYSDALQHYYRSLRIATLLLDSANEGNIYISLANLFVLLGQSSKALYYHHQAAGLFIQMGRRFELVNEYLNITDMYIEYNRLDSAEMYVRKALVIIEDMKNGTFLPNAYVDLGYIYKKRKLYPGAKNYFSQAIHYSLEAKNEVSLMNAYQGMGETHMASLEPEAARIYLDKHFLLAKEQENQEEIMEALGDLAENESVLHHFQKAYEYQKLINIYKDSAFSESAEKSMAEMEAKYEAEKKEKEIALLKLDQQASRLDKEKQKNFQWGAGILLFLLLTIGFLVINRYRVIQRSKRQLEMERIRNTIARDLHDDIGSTISSINILSKVALEQYGQEKNHPAGNNIQKIKERTESIMESMSDIVWAINPRNDTIEQMIVHMKEFAAEILEPLNINYNFITNGEMAEIELSVEKRKDFYLIFKEAINNSAKYSGCKQILINIQQELKWLNLIIEDDGVGFDPSLHNNGNGLTNMQRRADAMKGQLDIASTPSRGTKIKLTVLIS